MSLSAASARPVLMALAAAAVWGLWWMPIRGLEAHGLDGAKGGVAMSVGAAIACLVINAFRRKRVSIHPRALAGAALAGLAVSSYSASLNHTDVVRAVLLFYLAPAWSKLIEWQFLNMPWRWTSTVALLAAFTGAFLIFDGDISISKIRWGDLLALLSGITWAIGAALIFTTGKSDSVSLTLATSAFAALMGMGVVYFDGPSTMSVVSVWPVAMGLGAGVIYMLPVMLVTLWSAQRLAPATLSFLLTAEILTGVISGALFLSEPFGWMQVAGACLIVLGATAEVLPGLQRRRSGT